MIKNIVCNSSMLVDKGYSNIYNDIVLIYFVILYMYIYLIVCNGCIVVGYKINIRKPFV